MSTICKLDRNVRLDRYLRKQMRQDMQKDAATAARIVDRLRTSRIAHQMRISNHPAYPQHLHKLKEMTVRATVLAMMLKHITKICRDPARTGERKEAILAKLEGKTA